MITAVVFFLFISITAILGVATPAVRGVKIARGIEYSKASFYTAESLAEDSVFRLVKGLSISNNETLTLNNATANLVVSDVSGGKEVVIVGDKDNLIRKIQARVLTGDGVTFNYGIQAGDGGFDIKNTASIEGNAFSNGPVTGSNSNLITGDVISAGPNGLINGLNISGNAFSHTIQNSSVLGNAYYQSIVNTSVSGDSFPGSNNQATGTMPISDELIQSWKDVAESGGVSTSCTISNTVTIGPKKYNCSKLEIKGSANVTVAGHIWVNGNIEFENTATISVDQSLGSQSVAIIAHDSSNESSSGIITAKNSVAFNGPNNNYILLVSMNKSEANGGGTPAIEAENTINGDLLLYAPYGRVILKNSINLKEVTAYTIELQNSAQVIYETGLVNLLFTSGPSGGFSLDSWGESE